MIEAMPLSPQPLGDAEVREARAYLMMTARPGVTMRRLGREEAFAKLHPVFAVRLAGAIREARESGLPTAGCYSAFRPPAFGVGAYRDKFDSLHAYGLACDIEGIGAPNSERARLWHRIATDHQLYNPFYGTDIWWEWQHYQPTGIRVIGPGMALRDTITAAGPMNPESMWQAARELIDVPVESAAEAETKPPEFAHSHHAIRVVASARPRVRVKTARLAAHRGRANQVLHAPPHGKRRYARR